jgi:hypothetical protein
MAKKENNELVSIRDTMLKDISSVPYWVDTKKIEDVEVWNCVRSIISIISKCTAPRILTERTINNYIFEVNEYILDITLLAIEESIEIESSHFVINAIEKYLQLAVELEQYEICENLFNFKKKYLSNA